MCNDHIDHCIHQLREKTNCKTHEAEEFRVTTANSRREVLFFSFTHCTHSYKDRPEALPPYNSFTFSRGCEHLVPCSTVLKFNIFLSW